MRALAVIPARGGSQRIKMKNVRSFHGKPIIAYSILTARASGLFDCIIVSTDDERIAAVARAYGAKIHQRGRLLAQDEVGTQEVMAAVLEWRTKTAHAPLPEFACCIYPCAPLMETSDLVRGLDELKQDTMLGFVFSSDASDVDAGQWYWGRTSAFLARTPLEPPHAVRHYLPPDQVCDINTEEDWNRCEILYQAQERVTI